MIAAANWNSDSASPFVITELHGSGQVFTAHVGSWTTYWWYFITKPLPGHREIWVSTSWLLALVTVALIALAVRQIGGRREVILAAALSLAVAPAVLSLYVDAQFHNTTWLVTALLALFVVLLAGQTWSARRLAISAVAVALVAGTNLASDSVLALTGMLPFAVACIALWRFNRRGAIAGLGAAALSLPVAALTDAIMHAAGWHTYPLPAKFAHVEDIPRHLGWLLTTLVKMGGGSFLGQPLRLDTALEVVCGCLAIAAAAVPLVMLARRASPYFVFWGVSALATLAAFVLSTNAVPGGGERYLVTVLLACAATAPFLRSRTVVTLAVAVVAVHALFIQGRAEKPPKPGIADAGPGIAGLLEREHVTTGYAGYWDAASLTWSSQLKVRAYPVQRCRAGICLYNYQYASDWYRPHPPRKTFLIVDPATEWLPQPVPQLGSWSKAFTVRGLTVYIYDYDIATRIR